MKRSYEQAFYSISPENTGASRMDNVKDKQTVHHVVNMVYTMKEYGVNELLKYQDMYTVLFKEMESIDKELINSILLQNHTVKDITVKQVQASKSSDMQAHFDLQVDYYMDDIPKENYSIPVFQERSIVPNPMNKLLFAAVVTDEKTLKSTKNIDDIWQQDWDVPYNLIHKISDIFCNTSETPDDISIDVETTTLLGHVIYEIVITNFTKLSYTVLEYIDAIKPDNYKWNYKFVTDRTENKNSLKLRFVHSANGPEILDLEGETFLPEQGRRISTQWANTTNSEKPKKVTGTVPNNKPNKRQRILNFVKKFIPFG